MGRDGEKNNPRIRLFGRGAAADAVTALFLAAVFVFGYLAIRALVSMSFEAVANPDKDSLFGKNLTSFASLLGNVVAVSLVVITLYLMHKRVRDSLKLRLPAVFQLIVCLLLGAALNFFADTALGVIPFPQSSLEQYEELYSYLGRGNRTVEFIAVAFAAPVAEEIIFRGSTYGILRGRIPKAAAVVLSAALFGAAHGNLISFIFTFILGVILAVTFEATGSLTVPVLIHVGFNASSYVVTRVLDRTPVSVYPWIFAGAAVLSAAGVFLLVKRRRKKGDEKAERPDEKGEDNGPKDKRINKTEK